MKTEPETKDKVVDLNPNIKRVEPVQFHYRMILDKERDCSATTAYHPKEGESPNEMLDAMVAAMERLKAKHEISIQEKEIEDAELEMEINLKDLEGRQKDLPNVISDLKNKHLGATSNYTSEYKRLQMAEELKDRIFDPDKAGHKAVLNPLAVKIKEIEDEIKIKENEMDTDVRTTNRGIEVTNFRVSKAKAKIEKLRKLL